MSRHRSGGSYGHRIRHIAVDDYCISWTVDRHYANSRLRFSRTSERYTGEKGARAFARKWKLSMPVKVNG